MSDAAGTRAQPVAGNTPPDFPGKRDEKESRMILVGNPNVGKSVIFGFLTGRYVIVSNYPGTTVTLTRGKARGHHSRMEVVDTPGINSLIPMSEDEQVTRDILLKEPAEAVVQVADAKNLRRALIISTQLAEMGIPFVLDLNMNDEAGSLGVRIRQRELENILGVPVVRTVAVRRKGFDDLRQAVRNQRRSGLTVPYPKPIEDAIREMTPLLPRGHVAARGLAVMFLSGDESLTPWLSERLDRDRWERLQEIRRAAAGRLREPLSNALTRSRMRLVDEVVNRVETRPRHAPGTRAQALGAIAMHPVWGIPILLAVLYAMYWFVGVLGAGTLVDFLETNVFDRYLSPWAMQAADFLFRFPHHHLAEGGVPVPAYVLDAGHLTGWQQAMRFTHDFLVGPYGQITMAVSYAVAIILPVVATFFIAFGLLEDSGYLPRLAVMVNRAFRVIGLNGKAVLPMVLGLGCDTMATLTARIMETRKERILVTLLLALGVPCSAQLGVILGMMRSLSLAATAVWALSVLGTLLVVGWLAARVIPGQTSDFVMELPPIRRPQIGNIVVKTLARIEWYMREAVPLFLLGTLVLFLFDAFHLLGWVERVSAPVVQGILGLPGEASQSFLVGFLRRDYGAAGLYQLARQGMLNPVQLIVSMVTITLFVPCIANFFIIIKERGLRTALLMVAFIVPVAFLVGGVLNLGLHALGVTF